VALEAPVVRRLLCLAQLGELLAPPRERWKPQPLHDEAVHGFLHHDFGQEVLARGGVGQLHGGVVAKAEQLLPGERVFVVLDPLEQVLVVALFGGGDGPRPPGPGGLGSGVELGGREHSS